MITETEIEKANKYIWYESDALAAARANRLYLEQYRKTLKSRLILEAPDHHKTAQAKEAYAYSHPEMIEHLNGYKVAVELDESLRYKMNANQIRIEVWRTEQVNLRKGV